MTGAGAAIARVMRATAKPTPNTRLFRSSWRRDAGATRKRVIVMVLSFHAPPALRRPENSAADNFLRAIQLVSNRQAATPVFLASRHADSAASPWYQRRISGNFPAGPQRHECADFMSIRPNPLRLPPWS